MAGESDGGNVTALPQPLRETLRYLAAPGVDCARGRYCVGIRARAAKKLVTLGLAEREGPALYRVTGRGLVVAGEMEDE